MQPDHPLFQRKPRVRPIKTRYSQRGYVNIHVPGKHPRRALVQPSAGGIKGNGAKRRRLATAFACMNKRW